MATKVGRKLLRFRSRAQRELSLRPVGYNHYLLVWCKAGQKQSKLFSTVAQGTTFLSTMGYQRILPTRRATAILHEEP